MHKHIPIIVSPMINPQSLTLIIFPNLRNFSKSARERTYTKKRGANGKSSRQRSTAKARLDSDWSQTAACPNARSHHRLLANGTVNGNNGIRGDNNIIIFHFTLLAIMFTAGKRQGSPGILEYVVVGLAS